MTKKKLPDDPFNDDSDEELKFIKDTRQFIPKGVELSNVQQVSVDRLKPNSISEKFFNPESEEYFQKLKDDIKKRGIIVPLIAKPDGVLLAGHNRLKVANELGLETVPVQYVLSELTKDKEKEFVLKDNLLRRHLTKEERFKLYRSFYPNFDTEIIQETRGGDRKSNTAELKEKSGLTVEKIAKDTGLKENTVKKDITDARKKSKLKNIKENLKQQRNENQIDSVIKHLNAIEQILRNEDENTILKSIKHIDETREKLQKLIK